MSATGLRASVAAFAVLITGFGAMNLWWYLGPRDDETQLPGLYDFLSATWGDALLLPIVIAALVVLLAQTRVERAVPRGLIIALASAGFLLGAGIQIAWLSDPAPRLNWTLPQPHHFTGAGWYHAAFFAGACSVFLAMLGVLFYQLAVRRRNGWPSDELITSAALPVFVFGCTGFASLVFVDGVADPFTIAQLATWGTVAVAVLLGLVALVVLARQPVVIALRRLPAIVIWMVAVLAATEVSWHYRVILFAIVSLGVCVALILGREGRRWGWETGTQVATATFVCATCMAWSIDQWSGNLAAALLTPLVAMAACALFMISGFGYRVLWIDVLAVGVHLLVVVAVGLYLSGVNSVADPLFITTALAFASFLQVTVTRQLTDARYKRLIAAEEAVDNAETEAAASTSKDAAELHEKAAIARTAVKTTLVEVWTWMIGTYLATLVAVLTMTIGAVVSKGFQAGGANEWLSLVALLISGAIVCALAGTTALLAKRTRGHPVIFLPVIIGIVAWIAAVMSTQAFPYKFYYAPWSLLAGLVMGAVTYESVVSNVCRLNAVPPARSIHALAVGLGLLSAVNSYWLLAGVASGPGVAESLLRAVAAVAIALTVQLVILVCAGYAAQKGLKEEKLRTRYATSFNLFQDGILFFGLVLVFTFVPLFVYRHLEPLGMRRFWEVAFALGPTLTFVGGLLVMTLRNNAAHLNHKIKLDKQRKEHEKLDDMPIKHLSTHIKFQNRMAIALAAITVVGLANALQDMKELQSLVFLAKDADGGGGP